MGWVLASTSPRRKELFAQVGFTEKHFSFDQVAPDIDESHISGEPAADFVVRLAKEKAQTGLALCPNGESHKVLGSDTIVVLGEQILGKPVDKQDAQRILSDLSGKTHQVMTAVAVTNGKTTLTRLCQTEVTFCHLTLDTINDYIDTQEPMDKAGAYGIQGLGGCFVKSIKGSYSAVVGLPLVETRELLHEMNQIELT
ncbi:Maf family protein [Shewanella sp. 1_MG-2023]|uniref:Maf family protein n=1 Tax=unclassified Shewanella TaxID=196818 RepID=UPI0026E26390|nr:MULTISPECIES: Maf family protein [unclassified Shewanella]MDO6610594.1 Maf family protein [Shewanella sp. 7_MG-2023]MDO6770719.1 Maf family protein [Shewanella sp. 2_MG-2023]MDO6793263.1 Maf family protein [Shewanella sp. 1_MG-2023]